jgi:hypothetical protein
VKQWADVDGKYVRDHLREEFTNIEYHCRHHPRELTARLREEIKKNK